MKWYCFIITRDMVNLHYGYCKDVAKTAKNYKELPAMKIGYKNMLVWLEQLPSEEQAIERTKEIAGFTLMQKIKLVEQSNKDWVELVPGVNIFL